MSVRATPLIPFRGAEVWLVDLAASAAAVHDIEVRTPRLSLDDCAKCDRMADEAAGRERRAAHIALRVLIERAFGPHWRKVAYHVSAEGKPMLPGAMGDFSLSHIPGWALIALTSEGPIGADLERRRPVTLSADRRGQIEAAAAALAPQALLPVEPEAQLLQSWVRLEAVAKAEGTGIGPLLTELGVMRSGHASHASGSVLAEKYSVHDLNPGEGRYAAVAVARGQALPGLMILPARAEEIAALVRL